MATWPSTGQALSDIAQAGIALYLFVSVRSGGLRKKRQRDKRMDDWLDGTDATTSFEATPSAPVRLLRVEQAVAKLETSNRTLTTTVAGMREEMRAGLRAANTERQRLQVRDAT